MDPTKLPTLDPKLKETYERIMGTQLNTSQPQENTSQIAPQTPPDSNVPPTPADQVANGLSVDTAQSSSPSMDQLQTPALDGQSAQQHQDSRPQADLSSIEPSTDQSVAPPVSSEAPQVDMSTLASTPASTQLPPIPQPIPGQAVEPPATSPQPSPQTPAQPQPFIANQATIATGGFLAGTGAAPSKKAGLLPILYIVGGVIFFIAYIVFWIYFFQIPVPFLPF